MRRVVQDFAEAMEKKLAEKDAEYGTTWTTCSIEFLYDRLMREIEEFKEEYHGVPVFIETEESIKELVDIANVAMMLYHRIRQARAVFLDRRQP